MMLSKNFRVIECLTQAPTVGLIAPDLVRTWVEAGAWCSMGQAVGGGTRQPRIIGIPATTGGDAATATITPWAIHRLDGVGGNEDSYIALPLTPINVTAGTKTGRAGSAALDDRWSIADTVVPGTASAWQTFLSDLLNHNAKEMSPVDNTLGAFGISDIGTPAGIVFVASAGVWRIMADVFV